VTGSSQLVQALAAHDLVDGYKLWQFPVVLGAGKRLFAEGAAPAGLTLTDTQTSTTGVVISTYERQ
jgi:dihydrofolate reductase